MAVNKKKKRLIYLTACYPNEYDSNLESDLVHAYELLSNAKDRVVTFSGKTWTGNYYKREENFFAFQFAVSVPGEAASTLPSGDLSAASVEMGTTPPPKGHDFSEGDAICLVSKNHVFSCLSDTWYTTITAYLRQLFALAHMETASKVEVSKTANYDKLRLIQRKTIKSIQTDMILGTPEFARLSQLQHEGFGNKIARALSLSDMKLSEAAEKSKMKMRVILSGSKLTKRSDTGWFTDMGREVLENEHSYRIELSDGTVITPEDIRVSKVVSLKPNGKSVFVEDAIQKLEEFKDSILDRSHHG
ncbi:hypothetical protein [Desulfovibrio piger]|uniref:hypothetical protein n=1 Tax=Desulfovibrio piger TaxID=901 RepID=UPI0026F04FA7|nr:hypothetical protein [Desulfovibrio piger]